MYGGIFSPFHLLILISSAVIVFGLPVYLVFFIVKRVNQKFPSPPASGDTKRR